MAKIRKITLKSHKSVLYWYHEKEAKRLGSILRPLSHGFRHRKRWRVGIWGIQSDREVVTDG
jgi:hypothetical protein